MKRDSSSKERKGGEENPKGTKQKKGRRLEEEEYLSGKLEISKKALKTEKNRKVKSKKEKNTTIGSMEGGTFEGIFNTVEPLRRGREKDFQMYKGSGRRREGIEINLRKKRLTIKLLQRHQVSEI